MDPSRGSGSSQAQVNNNNSYNPSIMVIDVEEPQTQPSPSPAIGGDGSERGGGRAIIRTNSATQVNPPTTSSTISSSTTTVPTGAAAGTAITSVGAGVNVTSTETQSESWGDGEQVPSSPQPRLKREPSVNYSVINPYLVRNGGMRNDSIKGHQTRGHPSMLQHQQSLHNQMHQQQQHQQQHPSSQQQHPDWQSEFEMIPDVPDEPGICSFLLLIVSILIIFLFLPFSLFFCIKVVQEYERAVIFRLGRLLRGGARGPGIFFIIPCIDTYTKVDLRTVSFDVPPQEVLSKDSVTVAVDAVVYYRISNATIAITNVEDYGRSTRLLAATTLRTVLGTKNLSEILSERESISHTMQSSLDEATDPWGVKVERVEVKDVRLPVQMQRAMAAEAEATRESRAKVIAADGEFRASASLRDAADIIAGSPAALQLRYLQTLSNIAAEKNSTIVFPIPMELFAGQPHRTIHRPPSTNLPTTTS